MRVFKISEPKVARDVMKAAWETVKGSLAGGPVEVVVQRPSKSREVEKKYHAMIRDIQMTVELDGKRFDFETWKALLVQAFEKDMREQGTPLSHPGRVVPSLDGMDVVTVRASTTRFRVKEASDFVEWLYAWGTDHEARFSDESLRYYQELSEQRAA